MDIYDLKPNIAIAHIVQRQIRVVTANVDRHNPAVRWQRKMRSAGWPGRVAHIQNRQRLVVAKKRQRIADCKRPNSAADRWVVRAAWRCACGYMRLGMFRRNWNRSRR